MELLPEADKVVRTFLPVVLDAAGRSGCAQQLRDTNPINNLQNVLRAVSKLQDLRKVAESEDVDPRWVEIIEDSLFWTEAAIWAVVRKDSRSFGEHIRRANESMKSGLCITPFIH